MKLEDKETLKMIIEYLFFDQYTGSATFQRFEQCFKPLFNSKQNISMDKVFKEICGPKKKYMTGRRFLNSYLNFKKNPGKISSEVKTFFNLLVNKIVKKDPFQIGEPKENCYNYSTVKSSNKRECISQIQILTDKKNVIHGINIIYDDVFDNQMYPEELKNNLNISLEMNLGIVDESPIKKKLIGKLKEIKEKFYRDAVTHVFGTINSKNIITFLGFKCISGKTQYVGVPEGNGFLMGEFGKKFHSIKLQMTENGIHLLIGVFNENPRTNFWVRNKFDNKDFDKEEFVLDEKYLDKINNKEDIDKFITTPLIEDNHFFNNKLKDEISGNDYKEVVDQTPRDWILKKSQNNKNLRNIKKINNINDALKVFDEENKKSGENSESPMSQLRYIKGKKNTLNKKDKNKSKSKNKVGKKILHKKKKFIKIRDKDEEHDIRNNIPRWNGDKENIKKVNPNIFYKSKYNYKNLKNELARIIQEEIIENSKDNFTNNQEALLEELFPEMIDYQGKTNFNKQEPSLKKKQLKKKYILKVDENDEYKKKQKNNNKIYSDAMQMINDFSGKNKYRSKYSRNISSDSLNDDENLFDFSEKYFPKLNEEDNEIGILRGNANISSTTKRKGNTYISGTNPDLDKYKRNYYDPVKTKAAKENYQKFTKQLKKVNGIYLLQTMGQLLKLYML